MSEANCQGLRKFVLQQHCQFCLQSRPLDFKREEKIKIASVLKGLEAKGADFYYRWPRDASFKVFTIPQEDVQLARQKWHSHVYFGKCTYKKMPPHPLFKTDQFIPISGTDTEVKEKLEAFDNNTFYRDLYQSFTSQTGLGMLPGGPDEITRSITAMKQFIKSWCKAFLTFGFDPVPFAGANLFTVPELLKMFLDPPHPRLDLKDRSKDGGTYLCQFGHLVQLSFVPPEAHPLLAKSWNQFRIDRGLQLCKHARLWKLVLPPVKAKKAGATSTRKKGKTSTEEKKKKAPTPVGPKLSTTEQEQMQLVFVLPVTEEIQGAMQKMCSDLMAYVKPTEETFELATHLTIPNLSTFSVAEDLQCGPLVRKGSLVIKNNNEVLQKLLHFLHGLTGVCDKMFLDPALSRYGFARPSISIQNMVTAMNS